MSIYKRQLPWRNSASEMFVNLNIRSFDEMLRIFTFGFVELIFTIFFTIYLSVMLILLTQLFY